MGVPDVGAPPAARRRCGGRRRRHASARGTSVPAPTFLAIVFDRLTPEARALAHKGALASLETSQANDFVGVFLSDLSLVPIQTYTTDRAKLRKAIDEAATRATSVFDRDAIKEPDDMVPQAAGDFHPERARRGERGIGGAAGREWPSGAVAQSTRGRGPPAGAAGRISASTRLGAAVARPAGPASVNALRAVIEGLSVLPGRKMSCSLPKAWRCPRR